MNRKNIAIILLSCIAIFTSCLKEETEPGTNARDVVLQTERLSKTWSIDQAVYDGVLVIDLIPDLELTFNENNTWVAQNGASVFENQGTWQFAPNDLNTIIMDGVEVQLFFTVESTQLRLKFQLNNEAIGSARMNGLTGEYIIDFSIKEL
ncbi:MAG: hypothetical protein ACOCXH_01880 [Cyclobacteriaceae bacterium]